MDIIVCIKQVPGTSEVKVDPITGVLIRDGVESKMNPYDLFSLELALRLREQHSGTVRVVSMGPPSAAAVLYEALWMGADSGVLISDRRLGGADVLATAYTLSQAIDSMKPFDLVLCGKQTTDGDTAQVGAETAEFLHIPHSSNVREVSLNNPDRLTYVSELDNRIVTASVAMPCLLCAEAEINTPRLPSYKLKKVFEKQENCIKTISVDFFSDTDARHYGLAGSATKVERIFPPDKNTDRQTLTGNSEYLSDAIFGVLKTRKFI